MTRPYLLGVFVGTLLAAVVGLGGYSYDANVEIERLRDACGLAAGGAP